MYPALKVHPGAEGDQGLDALHLRNALVTLLDHLRRGNEQHEQQQQQQQQDFIRRKGIQDSFL